MIKIQRLTASGAGAIAIFRVTGFGAKDVIKKHFKKAPKLGQVNYGLWKDKGIEQDEVLIAHISENTFEISTHGGSVQLNRVIKSIEGAKEVEAKNTLEDYIANCNSVEAARRLIKGWNSSEGKALKKANNETLDAFLRPRRVLIAGKENAGKSTLFNLLLGVDRNIIHHRKGTTRDIVDVLCIIKNLPIRLIDSAGVMSAKEIQPLAVQADLTLLCVDGSEENNEAFELEGCNVLCIATKQDKGFASGVKNKEWLKISTHSKFGIDELHTAIREYFVGDILEGVECRPLHGSGSRLLPLSHNNK